MSDDNLSDIIPTDEDGNIIMPSEMDSLQLDTLEHPEYIHKDRLRELVERWREMHKANEESGLYTERALRALDRRVQELALLIENE